MPYITAKHIKESGVTFFDNPWFVSQESHDDIFSRCDPQPGDVLYIKDGVTTGTAAVNEYDFPFSMLSSVALLRPNPQVCIPKFLACWLNSPSAKEKHLSRMGGAAIKRLTLAKIKRFRILLPPLAEQKRIAGILDAADALRAKRRESLAQLDTLLQSTFLDMFGDPVTNPMGWEVEVFGTWLESIESGWSPKCLVRKAVDDEWGVLKLGAVTWCDFDETDQKALPPHIKARPDLEVVPGDLLFARKNTYDLVAAVAYVFRVRSKLMFPDLIFRLHLNPRICVEPKFLWRLLVHPRQRKAIQKLAGGAAGSMPNISKAKLKAVNLIKPPFDLQRRFAAIVESVERQKNRQRAHLAELDTLFASLQCRAFRGDL